MRRRWVRDRLGSLVRVGSGRVQVLEHPLVQHLVRSLRDARTPGPEFGRLTAELSRFVAYEALRDAPLREATVDTPLVSGAPARVLDEEYLVVPILRAGLGMLPGVLDVVPPARVCLVGLRRDERTFLPELYLDGLPDRVEGLHAVVCDPMLATGGSIVAVADLLAARGARALTVLSLIAATPGLDRLAAGHPAARVVTAALDDALDDAGYIVPGLGDAGDRLFGPPPR